MEIHYGTEPVDDDDDIVMEYLDEVMDHPSLAAFFSKLGRMFDSVTSRLERPEERPHYRGPHSGYSGEWPPSPRGQRSRTEHEPPPRQPPPAQPPPALEDPRLVLGFPPSSQPTEPEIRQRRRQLAAIVHPDKGGSTEAVQRINVAADRLLEELRAA